MARPPKRFRRLSGPPRNGGGGGGRGGGGGGGHGGGDGVAGPPEYPRGQAVLAICLVAGVFLCMPVILALVKLLSGNG